MDLYKNILNNLKELLGYFLFLPDRVLYVFSGMQQLKFRNILIACAVAVLIISCKKDPGGGGTTVKQPTVGTTWTYYYYTYYTNGGVATSGTLTFKAVSEESFGGETWLRIKNTATDTTVYLLKEKTDGLYQYANNSSNLFCKYPGQMNDTYSSFNADTVENFTIKGVNQSLPTNIGDVTVNFIEGYRNVNLKDEIWYNPDAWIVRHQIYRKLPLGVNYKQAALFIQSITY